MARIDRLHLQVRIAHIYSVFQAIILYSVYAVQVLSFYGVSLSFINVPEWARQSLQVPCCTEHSVRSTVRSPNLQPTSGRRSQLMGDADLTFQRVPMTSNLFRGLPDLTRLILNMQDRAPLPQVDRVHSTYCPTR